MTYTHYIIIYLLGGVIGYIIVKLLEKLKVKEVCVSDWDSWFGRFFAIFTTSWVSVIVLTVALVDLGIKKLNTKLTSNGRKTHILSKPPKWL